MPNPKKKKVTKKSSPRKPAVERPFPRYALEDALRIPNAIKDKNNGKPFASEDVATASGYSPKSTNFYYITAASRDYGLTTGTRDTKKIELTDLGESAVYPPSAENQSQALLTAFKTITVFEQFLDHFGSNDLPEMQFLSNTLKKEFGLDPSVHEDFVNIYNANCSFLNLSKEDLRRNNGSKTQDESTLNDSNGNMPPSIVEVATPTESDAPLCFVAMPFSERDAKHPTGFFDEVLRSIIAPAAKGAGFRVQTAKKSGSDVIQQTIVRNLIDADLVIADMTEHNPNVMFELGMRMALNKPIALIRSEGTGRIFDVDNMLRVYSYNPCMWPSTLAKDLPNITEHIKATWDNRETTSSYLGLLSGDAG